ncbi:ribonuclease H-like domain-containing protein [Irpex lacteus]|nr:ribonuclease H-like domain-containing protein [Irpex lacteus]
MFCATSDSVEIARVVLSTFQTIFMDCEGVELGVRGGSLCILSLGGIPPYAPQNLHIYLIDVLHLPLDILRSILDLIASPEVTKVLWDGRLDYSALYHDFGVQMQNVVDLQIVDILSRKSRDTPKRHIQRFNGYVVPGMLKKKEVQARYANVDRLSSLLRAVREHKPVGYKQFKKKRVDYQVWGAARPLPTDYITYAARDIEMIAALYEIFLSRNYITSRNLPSLSAKSSRYIKFWANRQPKTATRNDFFIGNAFLPLEVVDDISDTAASIPGEQKRQCRRCSRLLTHASFPPVSGQLQLSGPSTGRCWVCIAVEENYSHWSSRSKAAAKRSARAATRATKPMGSVPGKPAFSTLMHIPQESRSSESDSETDLESI